MSQFLPKSLFGQTLLALLVGLVISHAAGSWIYTLAVSYTHLTLPTIYSV